MTMVTPQAASGAALALGIVELARPSLVALVAANLF